MIFEISSIIGTIEWKIFPFDLTSRGSLFIISHVKRDTLLNDPAVQNMFMNWNETIPDDPEVICLHINTIDMSII